MNSPLFARLSVVVPVYNEEATLAHVVGKLLGLSHLHEVIVVDDCSTDRTNEIARDLAEKNPSLIQVIRHNKNAGKTEALKTGFAATSGNIVIVQDADAREADSGLGAQQRLRNEQQQKLPQRG